MSKIIRLPGHVISKIAAGEVIERPAYAVKELMENAIDAGADYIRIDIEKSGLQKIVVTDNGAGMNKDDIKLAFLPHTTSKIKNADDLNNIQSMGFRGEALASLAAISTLTIKSKTHKDIGGTQIVVENNKLQHISPVGTSQGTTVVVEQLFSHIPARKKFLKSLATEYRQIIQTVTKVVLAYPHIRFYVSNNKKVVLDLPQQTLPERIVTVLGKNTADQLIPLSVDSSYFHIDGFISKPQLSQHSLTKSYIFVNNRPINSSALSRSIREAYGTLLPPQVYPIYLMYLTVPPEMVDVNVHPRKEEVNFHNLELLQEAVQESIQKTLREHHLTFQDRRWKKNTADVLLENFLVRDGNTQTFAAGVLRDQLHSNSIIKPKLLTTDLLQLNNLYVLTQTAHGLVLIDQHAAHERILYEELLQSFNKEKKQVTQHALSKPVLLDVSVPEKIVLEENEDLFTKLGFSIKHFAGNTFKVSAVPHLFRDRKIPELLREMIEDITQYDSPKEVDMRSQRMLTYIACRSAIKAGDTLTKAQMKDLIEKLQKTENNITCPHGRPTQIEISLKDLHRLFHRI